MYVLFFFNDTATTEIYTLSLHDALPISGSGRGTYDLACLYGGLELVGVDINPVSVERAARELDRKSTRLNSSHANISYAVFCLKKKKTTNAKTCIRSSNI